MYSSRFGTNINYEVVRRPLRFHLEIIVAAVIFGTLPIKHKSPTCYRNVQIPPYIVYPISTTIRRFQSVISGKLPITQYQGNKERSY